MDIKVRDLKQTETIENENKLMVLVDDDLNLVKNITKEEFLTNVISSAENNALMQETDGNLYVNTSEISDKIGNLADLTTEDKTNLVAAINEAASTGGDGVGRNVGELVTALLPLTDAGLHLLDGTLIDGNGIYKGFVDYVAELYAENPNANYFTTETAWQFSVSAYGSCGKFVYDSTLNTVRLPKVSDILQCTTDLNALGDLIEAGLPSMTTNTTGNHQHNFASTFSLTSYIGGSGDTRDWVRPQVGNTTTYTSWSGNHAHTVNTGVRTASTVQPQTIKGLIYIVIANSTKTEIEVDIDNVATDLNGKAGTDLANVNNTGKVSIAHNASPSSTFRNLTLNASGSAYTAPADGCFELASTFNTNGILYMYRNAERIGISIPYSSGAWTECNLKVSKGDVIVVLYSGTASVHVFRFYYDNGSESEA